MPKKQQKRERDRQDVVLFFELIQIAIGNRAHLSFPPNNIQWNNTFTIASQQSLIGITFVGLNKIPKSQMPNELLILKWFGMTELLVKRNKILNLQCEEVQKEDRFLLSEILKAGNLGHYDVRENHVIYESRISTFFYWINHSLRLSKHYPIEVFWTPIGIIYISIRGRFISWLAKVV